MLALDFLEYTEFDKKKAENGEIYKQYVVFTGLPGCIFN